MSLEKTEFNADHPAWRCGDFADHASALVEYVNKGYTVKYDNQQLCSTTVLLEMIEDDSDLVNRIITGMIIKNEDDAKAFDAKTQELAEEAARSYKGQYDV